MKSKFRLASCAFVLGLAIIGPKSWAAEADQGRAYYLRYCGSCHGVEGKGGRGG